MPEARTPQAARSPNGSPGLSQHTAVALRVPKPKKTGNEMVDTSKDAERELLMVLIDNCIWDSSHIMPLHNLLMKRLASGPQDTGGNSFDKVGLLYSLPEEFLAHFITSVSDMSSLDIVAAKRFDPEAVVIMCKFGLDLPAHLKLPRECMLKDFMMDLLMKRHSDIGSRLSKLKESGTWDASRNQLNFKDKGCYRLTWRDGILRSVTHISGAVAELDAAKIQITRAYTMINNFSDRDAALLMEPLPPVHLFGFFKASNTGPFAHKQFKGGKAQDWTNFVTNARTEFDNARQVGGGGEEVMQAELDKLNKERKSEALDKARRSAKEALDRKMLKRKYNLMAAEPQEPPALQAE